MTTRDAAQLLAPLDHIYILTHQRPDGDTLGSAAGLCAGLRALGKTAFVLPNPELTPRYVDYVSPYHAPSEILPKGAVLLSVDIATTDLFPPVYLPLKDLVLLSIDHHPTNTLFGAHNCVVPLSASTGEIIFDILQDMGVETTPAVALPLYLAVSTDTGCFRYSNTTPHTHRVAAALTETGIPFSDVNAVMFETKTRRRFEAEALILESMDFFYHDTVAICYLTQDILARTGAQEDDVDNLSALPRKIQGVDIGILIKEQPGVCKISVRTSQKWEANRICSLLGGGGHARAAGCQFQGTVAEAKQAMLDALERCPVV